MNVIYHSRESSINAKSVLLFPPEMFQDRCHETSIPVVIFVGILTLPKQKDNKTFVVHFATCAACDDDMFPTVEGRGGAFSLHSRKSRICLYVMIFFPVEVAGRVRDPPSIARSLALQMRTKFKYLYMASTWAS